MSSLLKKHEEFKKTIARQEVYGKPVVNSISSALAAQNNEKVSQSRHVLDIDKDGAIFKEVTNNSKIIYNEANKTFEYKPEFGIRNKDELLHMLEKNQGRGGISVRELKDSYIDISKAIQELKQDKKILTMDNKDGTPRVLFCNTDSENSKLSIDQEFKDIWTTLRVPDETDLEFEMNKAGLKQMEVFRTKSATDADAPREMKKSRKFKITNTHLEGIDLTQDYVPK
ncbi:Transcription initiation factor IIE subunit beta [Zancudomyces culisetae]|uniref:Transcription initiation factor IIE subunit beta n=1 Tax=Zancudomyces culisetae TaxID=1213189 RepID=A0A1R1PQL4_ZANCU|nr:Transcription initiation factor IIE subunit beta [Zancudomyces culisetae]|eukprot:OMH83260.1 Transcription initiation factor IIE subunit beta [Zancudomyces culisetae]